MTVCLSTRGPTPTVSLPKGTQSEAVLAPAKEYEVSSAQAPRHTVAPGESPKRPTGHGAHVVLGLLSWSCVPGTQSAHTLSWPTNTKRCTPVAFWQGTPVVGVGARVVGAHVGLVLGLDVGAHVAPTLVGLLVTSAQSASRAVISSMHNSCSANGTDSNARALPTDLIQMSKRDPCDTENTVPSNCCSVTMQFMVALGDALMLDFASLSQFAPAATKVMPVRLIHEVSLEPVTYCTDPFIATSDLALLAWLLVFMISRLFGRQSMGRVA